MRPVYPAGESLPAAQRLCDALYRLPAEGRAACCEERSAPGFALSQCVLVVSSALRSGAVTLDARQLDACVSEQEKSLSGCAWVGPTPPTPPGICRELLHGRRKRGDPCRSSLECPSGLSCAGAGPTQAGVCSLPKSDGQACRLSVDTLASYAREDEELHHPECTGFCGHFKCAPRSPAGGPCQLASQCQRDQHCDGTACKPGPAAGAGERCVGGVCAEGLRCVAGTCAAPLASGAACIDDAQCLGGCLAASHVCGQRCRD